MPANLTPQYFEAEKRYKRAKSPQERIEALEEMLSVMPKHKGTDKLRAELRTKIAKLYDEAQRRPVISKKGSLLYYVKKEGAGQVILVGLPNVGKSQLVSTVTEASTEVADYPFTTQAPIPGMMNFENIQIQLVDIPAITAPHVESWLPNVLRNADLLLIVVDLTQDPVTQVEAIIERLEKFRIRLFGKEIEPGMVGKRALLLGNKGDLERAGEGYKRLSSQYGGEFPIVCISAREGNGLGELGENLYKALEIIRVYTKTPGEKPDMTEPVVVKKGSTVEEVAESVHKDFRSQLKYAQIWGSGKFDGQRVKRDYVMQEGDVIELHI